MKLRWLLESIGSSLLFFLPYYFPLITPSHMSRFHHLLPLTNLAYGLILDIVAAALLALIVLAVLSRSSSSTGRVVGVFLASLLLCCWVDRAMYVANRLASDNQLSLWSPSQFESISIRILLVFLCSALGWFNPLVGHWLIRVTRVGVSAIAFSGIWIVPSLWAASVGPHEYTSFVRAPSVSHPAPDQRIIWILFDELSYDQVFEHPPRRQAYPNFEKLNSESVSFANLAPIGLYTEKIIPSLFIGKRIDQIRSTADGALLYRDKEQNRWIAFDEGKSLFGQARDDGWNPGVAGWYNPYCRMLAGTLTACSWQPGGPGPGTLPLEQLGASTQKSIFADASVIPRSLFRSPTEVSNSIGSEMMEQHIASYLNLMQNARSLIRDKEIHFLFVHVPVPHSPCIYDRKTHRLREGGNYFDNLVLADDALKILLDEINGTAQANQTILVVSSDHSWRVPMWRASPYWTAEEEQISHGRFDQRPVFLIHFPAQSSGSQIVEPASELIENGIISAMLRGEVRSPQDLTAVVRAAGKIRGAQPMQSSAPLPRDRGAQKADAP